MTSLVIYILAFVIMIGIVGSITIFFSNHTKEVNRTSGASSEYQKFNLYMLDQTKNGAEILKFSEETEETQYITFSKDGALNTFVLQRNMLYFNEIKLCENVYEFKIGIATAENGKQVLKTYLNIGGTIYTTDYVIE